MKNDMVCTAFKSHRFNADDRVRKDTEFRDRHAAAHPQIAGLISRPSPDRLRQVCPVCGSKAAAI